MVVNDTTATVRRVLTASFNVISLQYFDNDRLELKKRALRLAKISGVQTQGSCSTAAIAPIKTKDSITLHQQAGNQHSGYDQRDPSQIVRVQSDPLRPSFGRKHGGLHKIKENIAR